ncbi:MAG: FdhF/YdeP family oxidoreductase [Acidobacteriia bacterium]|jgi:molybdopterin-dependent oxidoreductase alpha subunit|nr:FdhF/YdeP family oxidoreductase [Terriglobia bacterium]
MPARRARAEVASWVPFGIGHTKPHHYWEILRTVWENRDRLLYGWRILRHGVCDGCSLGPRGLYDDAMEGIHLCLLRLRMLRLNTMPALDPRRLADAAALERLSGAELRELGRLPVPLLRRAGEPGFRRIRWEEAIRLTGEALGAAAARDPDRIAFYTTSRGLTNETYYVAQKVARLLGTNNIDNAARLCHAASTTALKQTIGVAAATCSYTDWIGTELVVLLGSDVANNQPVAMKYLYHARRRGTRILVVNPYREPGLERYWVPSIPRSALFGTRMTDAFFQVRVGGDIAFLNGVLKHLLEMDAVDRAFIAAHTTGFEELCAALAAQSWEQLERSAGLDRRAMRRFAELYAGVRTAVFIWSMGLTQHRFGVENVQAVVNLALARGMVGRPNTGLVPVRGHSGVQGAAECGSVPNGFPGGLPVNEENARHFAELWGAPVPARPGLSAPEMLEAAARGALEVFYIAGGNFLETMPEPDGMRAALARVPGRIHQDLVVNSAMLVPPAPGGFVLLLPAQTRYEQKGGGTLTSTERRIRFSPEIPGPRIGEAMAEWEIFSRIGEAALGPERAHLVRFDSAQAVREEMERVMPLYRGIAGLRAEGDAVQYGGPLLCAGGVFAGMPGGRARFVALTPPELEPADLPPAANRFYLTTRRGKQFNSMIWGKRDPLTGARREDVLMAAEDAVRLGLRDGDRVVLRQQAAAASANSRFYGVCRIAPVRPGTLVAHWPEANVLIPLHLDPQSKEPDYNAWVVMEKA